MKQAIKPEVTINAAAGQFVVVGNEVKLTCHYNSSPPASEVRWEKDGTVVSRNGTVKNGARGNITHFNGNTVQLTVYPSISEDTGNYTCVVINRVGNSSDAALIIIQVVPSPPENMTVISKSSRVVNISWTPGFHGNSEIRNYTVEISTDNQTFVDARCQGLLSGCVISSSFTKASLEGLHPGRTYYIRVFATNKLGSSISSLVIFTTTDEEVPNAPPSNVQGRNTSSTSIFVQWGIVPAAYQNGIILSYTVTYKVFPGSNQQTKVVSASMTEATLTGLNEYTNYSITVFASTSKGNGNVSAPITVITDEETDMKYLNGKLTEDTNYSVFQRSFDNAGYDESEGFIIVKTKAQSKLLTPIIVPVVVVIVILLIVGGAVIVWRRRSRQSDSSRQEHIEMSSNSHLSTSESYYNSIQLHDELSSGERPTTRGQNTDDVHSEEATYYNNVTSMQENTYQALNNENLYQSLNVNTQAYYENVGQYRSEYDDHYQPLNTTKEHVYGCQSTSTASRSK